MKVKNRFKNFFSGLLGVVIGCVLTVNTVLPNLNKQEVQTSQNIVNETSAQENNNININDFKNLYKNVVKSAMPSVVGITTVMLDETSQDAYFDFFFGSGYQSEPRMVEGLGTGVIVDKTGYILTNSHVVDDGQAQKVNVLFSDGSTKSAEVKWSDSRLDLAIIKVEGDNYPVAKLGDSDKVEVGDIAIAIGNPLGLQFERSVTQGIISGLERTVVIGNSSEMSNLLQTDASINKGNSGGPLLNADGEVIGINTIKVGSGEGLGFSIPINTAKVFVDIMKENGEIKEKAILGIKGVTLNQIQPQKKEELKINIDDGVYVLYLYDDEPAKRSGMKKGDIIVKINDDIIKNMSDLQESLYKNSQDISKPMQVTVQRGKKQETLKVKLMKEEEVEDEKVSPLKSIFN